VQVVKDAMGEKGARLTGQISLPGRYLVLIPNSKTYWVVDPLDGTTNFAAGIPYWSISVARFVDGKPQSSFLIIPTLKKKFVSIKGKGTILTGTVLSGGLQINDTVELPSIRVEKKIKSIQMFRRPVESAIQGDRLGICVAGLDAKSMERGFVATPGSVPSIHSAVAHVRRVKAFFFKGKCRSKTKIHISIGHTTAMATVTFFGSKELAILQQGKGKGGGTTILNDFNADNDYLYQDELLGGKQGGKGGQWALIEFDGPVMCPVGSL